MDLAWIALAMSVGFFGILTTIVFRVSRALRDLQVAVENLRQEILPVVRDIHGVVQRSTLDLGRVENLLDTADELRESAGKIGATIQTDATLSSSPVIRLVGFIARLRRRRPSS